jgi:hypothetical protein
VKPAQHLGLGGVAEIARGLETVARLDQKLVDLSAVAAQPGVGGRDHQFRPGRIILRPQHERRVVVLLSGRQRAERARPVARVAERQAGAELELLGRLPGITRVLERPRIVVSEHVRHVGPVGRQRLDPRRSPLVLVGALDARNLPICHVPHQHVAKGVLGVRRHR